MTGYNDRLRFYQGPKKPPVNADLMLDKLKTCVTNQVLSRIGQLTFTLAGSVRQNPVNEKYYQKIRSAIDEWTKIKAWRMETARDTESSPSSPNQNKGFNNQ